jgi:hypothetical protein
MRSCAQTIGGVLTIAGGLLLGALGGCFSGLVFGEGVVYPIVIGAVLGLGLALYAITKTRKE